MYLPIRRFEPGNIYMTAGAARALAPADRYRALSRHLERDWGDICDADKDLNDSALKTGGRLISAYRSEDGIKFWIITEADRSATTILLPEEY